ncbi:MAG TPA: GTP 3',8-cyclase MoaA, partial [Planctomycetota bacterium]|nr:GTP 3',8-cyclase MoaA [Planctomycetota bacterium]
MVRLPLIDHARYERALRMASAAREAAPAPAEGRAAVVEPGRLADRYGRAITYLRLSVTDRCNLRCVYCTPVSNGIFLPRDHLLSDDEIVEVLQTMARAGLEKVRFTGGEPLVRPGFLDLVARVAAIEGLRELCVSTNGLLLEEQAGRLLELGVTRFNVSIDTLDPRRFAEVTRGGDLAAVWRGIEHVLAAAEAAPEARIRVKINAVLMKGVNDGEVEAFAGLTREKPLHVRFIELMPLAHCGDLHDASFVSSDIVLAALERMGGARPVERTRTDGPALMYALEGAHGTVGVISPVSETHFCDRCNRVRLGADGTLKLCLFGDERVDLRAGLRGPRTPGDLERALAAGLELKP